MSIKKWHINSPDAEASRKIASDLDISPFLARLLSARGAKSSEDAKKALFEEAEISDPLKIKDMDKAVEAVRRAVAEDERICIFGDYDCDGVTAVVILQSYLESLGADVFHYIPDRANGYGMNKDAVRALAKDGVGLIITVDNGIAALEEAELVYELGMKLVVTDHHQVGKELPRAEAVVDLHRPDCDAPFKEFCGAGVAFLLVCAMEDGDIDFIFEQYGDLAAIATVGDIVSLKSENKTIVTRGLSLLPRTERPGLIKLIELSAVRGEVDSTDIAFRIVPRINAAGRFSKAELAAELLLCEEEEEAKALAERLCDINSKRRSTENEILEKINAIIVENPRILNDRILVFAGEDWHQGVLGIISARLLEAYRKPVIVMSVSGGEAHGSCRSVDGFSIYNALCRCSEVLERFGGHPKAAGLTVKAERIEEFRRRINNYAKESFPVMPTGEVTADMVLLPGELTLENAEQTRLLEPFGEGNRRPQFALENAVIKAVRPLKDGKYTQIKFDYGERKNQTAVTFKTPAAEFGFKAGDRVDMIATLDVDIYKKTNPLSLVIAEIRPHGFNQDRYLNAKAVYEQISLGEGFDPRLSERIIPDRSQIGAVYKYLQGREISLDTLCYKLHKTKISYCMMMVAVDVLCELGLAELDPVKGTVRVFKADKKVSLESSAVLSELKNQKGAVQGDLHN